VKILVTGHDGYIGSVFTPMARAAGHEVSGLDAFWFEGCTLGPEPEALSAQRLDIRDTEIEHLRGFDAVVHLAAISNDPLGHLDPARTYEINHHGSFRIAQLAKRAEVERFIFASSCSLYGAASPDDLLTESASFNPVTPYGESKVLAERAISQLADDDFSPVFLRNATVYGYSSHLRLDLVVNDLVASAFVTGDVLIKSDGTPWRPLVHVEDVCNAILAALVAPREAIHGEAFNIGRTPENHQVRDVADLITEVLPDSRITYADGGGPDARCYRVDFSKALERLPGFRPRWTVRDGAEELVDAYRRFGLSANDLASPRFVRLGRIQALQLQGALGPDLRMVPRIRDGLGDR
jgi:nucleoside-diphosphate-sugar epimerase